MSILILIFVILILILLCIAEDEYKRIRSLLVIAIIPMLLVLATLNVVFDFRSNTLYNHKEYNMVIIKCTNVDDDCVKYTCKIANENVTIGKHFRFVDDIGRYNVGDTITFNKK